MSRLEQRIFEARKSKDILIMSHAVMGYPSFEVDRKLIDALVGADVELIELQFPFSEPIADGPTLLKANHQAVSAGTTVDQCFAFAGEITSVYPATSFLIMTYYNILYARGVERFIKEAAKAGVLGVIVPDITPEQAEEYLAACSAHDVAPIFLVTPTTPVERLDYIASKAQGLIYCVARKGITGIKTIFSKAFDEYINRVRKSAQLPIGVGFGVQLREDVEHLKGRADVAIICSKAIKICVEEGPEAVGQYMSTLR
ncbi:tryptophan synthase subunit alpha [Oligoflexia bacterium]|nr:tryptophan synthase subunit alpha [Oligoflexia bacterium]